MSVAVYAETFGNVSEAWMHRQVVACGVPLLTHAHRNPEIFPCPSVVVVDRRKSFADRLVAGLRYARARHGYRLPASVESEIADRFCDLRTTLVHAHYGPAGIRMVPLARRLRMRLMVTFHGFDANVLPRDDPSYRRALRLLFGRAWRILAVSRSLGERVAALGCPRSKLEVLPMGVPLRPLRMRRPSAGPVRAITVARLHPVKGVPDLVDAIALARRDGAEISLDIVGDGPERAEVEARVARQGLGAAVRLHGMQPPEAVARLLDGSDLFVLNSRTSPQGDVEALGISMLEAMAAGLPVVAARHGGIVEAVDPEVTGLLVEEGDTAALARALVRMTQDPAARVAMGGAGRARVERDYDERKSVARLKELYAAGS